MNFEGMDVGQVRSLAQRLGSEADDLDHRMTAIDAIVARLAEEWQGRDAFEAVTRWRSELRPHFLTACDAVWSLAESARRNADDQEAVSGR